MKSISDIRCSDHDDDSNKVRVITKSASIGLPLTTSEKLLTVQISAPSYLHSLKENQAPPFKKPGKEEKPRLLIGTIVTENDVIEMIVADTDDEKDLEKHLGEFLINKKIVPHYCLSEKALLVSLLLECINYSAQRDFPATKVACLMTIYLATHAYFRWYYWLPPAAVWKFLKEVMIRHTIEDSPDGQEVFEPEECYDILTHFHTMYLTNLPLIHIVTFSVHRLKFLWPFKPK
ncbi:uncharacterized protein LOC123669694 [Melitaea cinxia]|uniref:uncharacterized protein LOC123669694 n=1 Tax=Melitaea cinxia TaxID=113334 RepID=UPI001E274503|nr:uncharacterized protein LOC123669694 [Melitaea cinxia]